MVHVGVKELKMKLSSYVVKASKGEEIVVTDHGKEVAVIVPISSERRRIKSLMESGKAKWSGKKPTGLKGISVKGEPISKTVLEERR
ncbi:MAG: type II toxin-antitoxin system prevent-host-death family antitoxin [Thermodesulfobacteriota bacterium]